ncbi:hypothetical protein OJ253_987 [Cryptosporidium canis]|uniref:Uncharacterized protein n=1 Tax=Cryptosporidium canis TaxID=195482 RepID=A0A9D5DPM4_9CRYT|nr:hypothetical protein OJ253_987 [Cryptosporidium canis]
MISDSNFNTYHIHHLEKVLDEKELKSWNFDLINTLPEISLSICNVDRYKDTDDALEVNIIDSIQLYQKEAVETQLSSIEKLVNLNGKHININIYIVNFTL